MASFLLFSAMTYLCTSPPHSTLPFPDLMFSLGLQPGGGGVSGALHKSPFSRGWRGLISLPSTRIHGVCPRSVLPIIFAIAYRVGVDLTPVGSNCKFLMVSQAVTALCGNLYSRAKAMMV